ncbi:hypothetical protein GF407_16230 [candidate division KSB1 bacterium]|nr:hypothetical protein [candidate division KSB1 bacterium]
MKIRYEVFLFISIMLSATFGLTAEEKKTTRGGVGYFMLGYEATDLSDFNDALEAAGYSTFAEKMFSMGGAGYAIKDRLIIGGEGYALIQKDKRTGTLETSLSGGVGFFNIGYILHKQKNFWIYPLLGLGGGGMNFSILEKSQIPSFEEVLENPERGVDMYAGGLLLQVAIGGDVLLNFEQKKDKKGGLVLALRIGYTFTPMSDNWYMNDMEITGGPDLHLTGPFVRLGFGGGGFE